MYYKFFFNNHKNLKQIPKLWVNYGYFSINIDTLTPADPEGGARVLSRQYLATHSITILTYIQ